MKVKFLNMILDKKNKLFKFLLGFIISSFLVYYSIQSFNLNNFKEMIIKIDYKLIFLSIILLMISVYLRGLRWRILLDDNYSKNFLYKAQLIGYFGNNILPLRLGEILKSYIVGEKYKISKSIIFGSIILERILDMFIVGLFILVIFIINANFLFSINIALFYGLLFIAIIGLIGVFIAYNKINFKVNKSSKISLMINDLYIGFANLNNRNFIYALSFSIVIWLIYLFQVYLMQCAFYLDLTINQSLILLVISTAAISIPALPGNFGTFEGAVVYSLSLFNIVDNFGFAFILHSISFVPYTILGFFYLIENFKLLNRRLKFYE